MQLQFCNLEFQLIRYIQFLFVSSYNCDEFVINDTESGLLNGIRNEIQALPRQHILIITVQPEVVCEHTFAVVISIFCVLLQYQCYLKKRAVVVVKGYSNLSFHQEYHFQLCFVLLHSRATVVTRASVRPSVVRP